MNEKAMAIARPAMYLVSLLFILIGGVAGYKYFFPREESSADNKVVDKKPSSPPAQATGATAPTGTISMEVVPVFAPFGNDESGKELRSEPIPVTVGSFSFGFSGSDPKTGCFHVWANDVYAGKSCADKYLDVGLRKGDPVTLQFGGIGRPMALAVLRKS